MTVKIEVKYLHEFELAMGNLVMGNIIWAERNKSPVAPTSTFARKDERFPADHPAAPSSADSSTDGQMGSSKALLEFRARGYYASCFPEGDGVAMKTLNGQDRAQVVKDIEECFGWKVVG
jgi:hypothetical protein